jgi:3-oxoisoapionate kinase
MSKRFISFYGDDFTGSTDVMEALASHGVKTVLFTRIPTPEEFEPFKDYEAIGIAGTSRSQTPQWMDENLPRVFEWLKSLGAQFCHYKICSTFDSSPEIGSIGRAIELGLKTFNQLNIAMIVGAPQLKRYTFAGHLFAGYQGQSYRIDRHPVMSTHPVTPMKESDLAIHLSHQTKQPVNLIDVHDDKTQAEAGVKLLALAKSDQPFIVGSSGVEYALMKGLEKSRSTFPSLPSIEKLLVISGSVSPTTERQIRFALNNGFAGIEADALALSRSDGNELERVIKAASTILEQGQSPLIYTALGAATDKGQELNSNARQSLSRALGYIAKHCIAQFKLKRLIIAGGDTSSHAISQLNISALVTRFPLAQTPGSPLCTAFSNDPKFNGLEIAMKGGQVGGDDYFVGLRDGVRAPPV